MFGGIVEWRVWIGLRMLREKRWGDWGVNKMMRKKEGLVYVCIYDIYIMLMLWMLFVYIYIVNIVFI